ncbi:hypothetical protein VTK56DRAFT_263 [Thermocarpiscus australiensis]
MAIDFSRLTVLELRQELKRRNLPQNGKKADLVDRLIKFENEQTTQQLGDAYTDNHDARESPSLAAAAGQQSDSTTDLLATEPPATSLQPSVAEDVPAASADNHELDENSKVDTDPRKAPEELIPSQNRATLNGNSEVADSESATATEIVKDAASRKRRSRSPPPEKGSSRKRARPNDGTEVEENAQHLEAAVPLSDNSEVKDASFRSARRQEQDTQPGSFPQSATENHAPAGEPSPHIQEGHDTSVHEHNRNEDRERPSPIPQQRRRGSLDEPVADYDRDVAPSQHPATSALYIKNFMRPLREPVLRDYLIDLAAGPGGTPDPRCLANFYLDQIRTHAFVRFTSVSAASRVRSALHGTVWPNERNRKELWVDFIPEDKVVEWATREQTEGGRGTSSRWEVEYEPDNYGNMTARLVNAEAEPVRRNTRQPLGPPPVPTGPARDHPAVEGAPLGPRGRGGNHYRQPAPPTPSAGGDRKTTRANPPLQYKPVSEELAQRRLANMNSYYTKDRHRDLGLPDEINRYTFENGDAFVDRGKEVFIGIRPPHRERERRRLGLGRGNRARRDPSPRPSRDEGYHGSRDDYDRGSGRRDRRDDRLDDVPRSRFDGQPLPTYNGPRRPGRGGGGRRDRY